MMMTSKWKKVFSVFGTIIAAGLMTQNAHADITNGLVAQYLCNGNLGSAVGTGRNLSALAGAITYGTGTAPRSQFCVFDGSSTAKTVDGAIPQSGPVTYSFFIRANHPENALNQMLIMQSVPAGILEDSQNSIELPGGSTFQIYSVDRNNYVYGASTNVQGPTPFPINSTTWTHIAITSDGTLGSVKIYANGIPVTTELNGPLSSPITLESTFFLGRSDKQFPGVNGFIGNLDDIRLYNRVLSEAEILVIANTAEPTVVNGPCTLDMDGDGIVAATKEGVVMLRALFGMTGTAVIQNTGISLTQWNAARTNLNANCGTNFAP